MISTADCWLYAGVLNNYGYGHITFWDRELKHITSTSAHRAVYAEEYGPIDKQLVIDHLCRNRPCINPDHLEAVTKRMNIDRGNSLSVINARKTHCKWGHEFTPENTRRDKLGRRNCRKCHREIYK